MKYNDFASLEPNSLENNITTTVSGEYETITRYKFGKALVLARACLTLIKRKKTVYCCAFFKT